MDMIENLISLASKKETYWEAYSLIKLNVSSQIEFNLIMCQVRVKWLDK